MWWMESTISVLNLPSPHPLPLETVSQCHCEGVPAYRRQAMTKKGLRSSLLGEEGKGEGSEDDRFFDSLDNLLWFIDQLKNLQIRS
jgi:hypothetical protein